MNLPLPIHISIHLFFGLLAGLIVFRLYKKPVLSFICAIISGVLVDVDHFMDYFMAFGWSFNLLYFTKGFEFLKSNKMYTLFHGWEYVLLFLFAALFFSSKKVKTVFLALALGLFFHLGSDVIIDRIPVRSYSLVYKINNNFDLEKLVSARHWQKHEKKRKELGFE